MRRFVRSRHRDSETDRIEMDDDDTEPFVLDLFHEADDDPTVRIEVSAGDPAT